MEGVEDFQFFVTAKVCHKIWLNFGQKSFNTSLPKGMITKLFLAFAIFEELAIFFFFFVRPMQIPYFLVWFSSVICGEIKRSIWFQHGFGTVASKSFVKFNWASWLAISYVSFRLKCSFLARCAFSRTGQLRYLESVSGYNWASLHHRNTASCFHLVSSSQNGEKETTTKLFAINRDPETTIWPIVNIATSSVLVSVSFLVAFGYFAFPWITKLFRLAARTYLDL